MGLDEMIAEATDLRDLPRRVADLDERLRQVEEQPPPDSVGPTFVTVQPNGEAVENEGPEGPEGAEGPEGPEGPEGGEGPEGAEGKQGKEGKEGPEGKPGSDNYSSTPSPEIFKWVVPGEKGVLLQRTLVVPKLVPRVVSYLAFQFGRESPGAIQWENASSSNGGNGESEFFPSWFFGWFGATGPTAFPPPKELRTTRGATSAEKEAHIFFMCMGAPNNGELGESKQVEIAKPGSATPSLEVTIPARCVGAWAGLVRTGEAEPTARSDSFVARGVGPCGKAQGQYDIQRITEPTAGKHTFKWTYAAASGEAERILVGIFAYV